MSDLKFSLKPGQIAWGRAPVRLDLAGGWTDTPPYTNRFGGRVVNVAVDLNGQPPVQVYVQRIAEKQIRFHSIDLDCRTQIVDLVDLMDYNEPTSAFGLVKAALYLVWKQEISQFEIHSILERLKGGLAITTFVAVPKGSGLGTSSVLGAVILGALNRSFGLNPDQNTFIQQVLMLEQMMTTGGGWQDQVGGAFGGVKYTVNHPGCNLNLDVEHLDSKLFTDAQLTGQFVLYYTGHTRLAKNILQEVVNRVKTEDQTYLDLHVLIGQLADKMRSAISRRNLDEVGRLLGESWECKKQIHSSATNQDVEELFEFCKPFCRAGCLMGAGGGGYALFLANNLPDAVRLKKELNEHSDGNSARVVEWQLNVSGLQVSLN